MPSITVDEIITYRHKRNYIQFGGARPQNGVLYAGQGAQYMVIEGVGVPELGGVDPIWVPDPRQQGKYRLAGRKYMPPGLPKAQLTLLERHGSIPRQLQRIGCQFNLYELTGACNDLSDFTNGWTDYILIYSGALVTEKDYGTRSVYDSDSQVEDKMNLVLADIYPVGALGFGEQAAAQVDREVTDIAYGSKVQCGDCGVPDDGTARLYACTKSSGAGSPGLPARIAYSLDGGVTWADSDISGLTGTYDFAAIEVIGNNVVVVSPSDHGYWYAPLNINGVPGTWTLVTSGFVANKDPRDIISTSPREVYFCGDGGYIYKSTDITAGVTVLNAGVATSQNLLRIKAANETIVAVGKNSTCVKSVNRGQTFALTTVAPSLVLVDCQAVEVLDSLRFWVGTATGRLVYTTDGGESWVQVNFSGAGAGQVYDVVFASNEVGYFSHSTATPTARIFTTYNGGADWAMTPCSRILNMPTYNRANRIAVPVAADVTLAVNNVAIAGLSGGGTDGIILVGAAARV